MTDNKRCTNSEITLLKIPTLRTWILPYDGSAISDVGPSSSTYTLSSNTIITTFQNTGLKTIGVITSSNATITLDGYVLITTVSCSKFMFLNK